MKIFIMFFLVGSFCFAQNLQQVQLRLVNETVGSSVYNDPLDPNYGDAVTNDSTLNVIFQTHDAFEYIVRFHIVPEFNDKTYFVACSCDDIDQFVTDLQNHSAVIEYAKRMDFDYTFIDALEYRLVDTDIGFPTGDFDSNGNALTTNDDVNEIFATHQVFYANQPYPDSGLEDLYNLFEISCVCELDELKSDLDNLNSVISETRYIADDAILSIETNSISKFTIHPNPIDSEVIVANSESVRDYQILDVNGKIIEETTNVDSFKGTLNSLKTGVYFVKATSEDNRTSVIKILKK